MYRQKALNDVVYRDVQAQVRTWQLRAFGTQ